jgi:hypothetical protein
MKIDRETAKKLYPDAPDWLKEQMINEFGAECFKPKEFEDIKTYEDACEKLNIDPIKELSGIDRTDEIAYRKLKVIARAINNGWLPNWSNTDQRKWFPYFVLSSGFGFSVSIYDCDLTDAGVGSRLCFETSEQAVYAGQQFTEIYKDFLTITE